MPCPVLDAVLVVEVHSCMDTNLEIAVVKKNNPVGLQGILASRYTVTLRIWVDVVHAVLFMF